MHVLYLFATLGPKYGGKGKFIYLFIHYTACSPQAMAGKVQTNNHEQA